jgi:hypothetical protein
MPQRQAQGRCRDGHHQHERRAAADQAEQDVAAVSGRVEHGQARPDQRLCDPRIVGQEAAPPRIFAGHDQGGAEQGGRDHARGRRHQLDRMADQEDAGRGQRHAARPDQQAPADQPLKEAGRR